MSSRVTLFVGLFFVFLANSSQSRPFSELLELAYKNNPGIQSLSEEWRAEKELVKPRQTIDSPVIGYSELDRGLETHYVTISQKIKFPTKYSYESKIQRRRALGVKSQYEAKKLEVRQQVLSLYYSIFSLQKVIQLTEANIQSVREFARVAEKKYAAGRSSQSDSMKAHFEQTQLELDLISLKQEESGAQSRIKALVNEPTLNRIELGELDLRPPLSLGGANKESDSELKKEIEKNSPVFESENQKLLEVNHKKSLAQWSYIPDLQVQYQHRISGQPEDSKIFSIGLTIPLWFWKEQAEVRAASRKVEAQRLKLQDTVLQIVANVKDLKERVLAGKKTLKIYQTSLIPQAQGAFNATRSAYQANRTSFLDLLDSERSLYRVKTGYYRAFRRYMNDLGELEKQLGQEISNVSRKNKNEVKKDET